MFDNDILERFSRIHPATPFVVWLPVFAWMIYRAHVRGVLSSVAILGYFAVGYLIWSLTEYVLHRWVFHAFEDDPKRQRLHFLLHGVHHDYPTDRDRLVMPLLTSVPVGSMVCGLFFLTMGATYAEPAFAGFTIGYLSYDGIHYWLHRYNQTTRVGKWLKHHHMRHHYMDHDGGFGVSSPLWDVVFRTMPSVKKPVAARKPRAAVAEGAPTASDEAAE